MQRCGTSGMKHYSRHTVTYLYSNLHVLRVLNNQGLYHISPFHSLTGKAIEVSRSSIFQARYLYVYRVTGLFSALILLYFFHTHSLLYYLWTLIMSIPPPMASSTANWHWKNKTVTPWARSWFERELATLSVQGEGSEQVGIAEITEFDGDVELGQRKSKCVNN